MKKLHKPLLIALEGIDGTGKSTQLKRLGAALNESGYAVVVTAEPTAGPYGQKIREAKNRLPIEEEISLFLKDREQHYIKTIKPALEAGYAVITDRYLYSSVAYQGIRVKAPLSKEDVLAQNLAIVPHADCILYFDLEPSVAFQRITENRSHIDAFETLETLSKVYDAYTWVLKDLPQVQRVNANQTKDALLEQILAIIITKLSLPHA